MTTKVYLVMRRQGKDYIGLEKAFHNRNDAEKYLSNHDQWVREIQEMEVE